MLRHVFLQDVVLDRALKLIARYPLLLSTRSNTMTDITNIPLDKLTAWEGNVPDHSAACVESEVHRLLARQ